MRFQVINPKTKEVLFESDTAVNIAIHVDNVERGRMTGNDDGVSCYLRDSKRLRADIDIGRTGFGLWTSMKL